MGLLTALLMSRIRLPRDIHRFAFRRYPDRVAVQFPDRALTYRELEDRTYRLVQAWRAAGLRPGDVVFAQVDVPTGFFEIRSASLEEGIVLTFLHSLHSPEFVTRAATDAQPKLFLVDSDFAPGSAEAMLREHPSIPQWDVGAGGEFERQLLAHSPAASRERLSSSDPMAMGFTSGTTGPPKGLISSQGAMVASLKMVVRNFTGKPDPKAISVSLSPIPFVGAGSGLIMPSMLTGGTLVPLDAYTPETLVAAVKKHRVTRLFLTPSHLIDLLDLPRSVDQDLATVTHIIYGTAPMPAQKLEEAIIRFGPIFSQGYGQAEVMPPVSLLSPEEHIHGGKPVPRDILRSSGRVAKGVEVRICDPGGQHLPAGETGEIRVKSPTRLLSYLDSSQNQGAILDDGFFRTGDHGYLDDAGYLHVLDRDADVIRSGSITIYPRVVEEEAHDHPAVKECCLVEIDRVPTLIVSVRRRYRGADEAELSAELRNLLGDRLPLHHLPEQIKLVDEIPRSFLGKVLRKDVRTRMSQ